MVIVNLDRDVDRRLIVEFDRKGVNAKVVRRNGSEIALEFDGSEDYEKAKKCQIYLANVLELKNVPVV